MNPVRVKRQGAPRAAFANVILDKRELLFDNDSGTPYFGDATTPGGVAVAKQSDVDARLAKAALPTTAFPAIHLTKNRSLEQWFGEDRLNVMGMGVKGDGVTLDTNAIRDAISRMRDTGIALLFPSRPYAIDGDFLIAEDFDGFAAMFEGSGAAFIQKALGAGLWNIRGNNAKLTGNFGAVYEGVRVPINGRYRGFTAFQRMCVVWVEGSGLQIDGTVSGNNMFNTVCHRGPVKRLDGTPVSDLDTAALLDGSQMGLNNYIRRITGRGQDFALTGSQWDGFTVGSLYARTITAKQLIPPHAIYATPGGVVGAKAKNTTFGPMRCIDSPYGTAFKMRYFESGTVGPLSGDSTAGALSAAANSGVAYQLGDWTNLIGNIPPDADPEDDAQVTRLTSAIDLQQCADVTVTGGLLKLGANQSLNGTRIRMGCKAIVIQDMVYSDNQSADQSATPFRAEGAEVTFVNVSRQRLGAGDKEMFVATSGPNAIATGSPSMASTVRTVTPRQRGSTKLAVTDTASTISGTFDSGLIEGYLPTTSMSGAGIQLTDTRRKDFTFVPTLLGTGGTQPPSYTVQGGRCIRTGNMVTYEIHMGGTTTGFTGTSVIEIGNLPYKGQTSGMPTRWIARATTDSITVTAGSTVHAVMSSAGLPSARMQVFTDQARANLLASALGSTWRIDFSLTIETDDPF